MGKVRYSLAIILPVILAVAGGILMHDDIESQTFCKKDLRKMQSY